MTPDTAADEIRRFEEQFRQNPDSLVFARLADAYRRSGDTERALEILEEGIDRHPDYASAFIIRARTYTDLARFEQAEEALRRVLDLDAQNQVAMLGLADLAERRGAVSEALGWQERIIAAYPQNQEALAALERLRPLASRSRPELEDLAPPVEEWWSSSVPGDSETEATPFVGFDRLPDDVAEDLDMLDRELAEDQPDSADDSDFVTEIFGSDDPLESDDLPDSEDEPDVWSRGEESGSIEVDLVDADPIAADSLEVGPLEADPLDADLAEAGLVLTEASIDIAAEDQDDSSPQAADGAGAGAWWFEDPSETEPAEDGDLLTRTMADLYARQGLVDEAASIYRELLAGRPDDPELLQALADVEDRLAPVPAPEADPEPTLEPETESAAESEPESVELESLLEPEPAPVPEPRPVPDVASELEVDPASEAEDATAAAAGSDAGDAPVDPYASYPVPRQAAGSDYFAEWLRRLTG